MKLGKRNNKQSDKDRASLITGILKGVFSIATLLSNFDLKLSFHSRKIVEITGCMKNLSNDTAAAAEEITSATAQIADTSLQLSNSIEKINAEAIILGDNFDESNRLLKQITVENKDVISISEIMKVNVDDLVNNLNSIRSTIKGINDISEQIEILSVNASIEAARAGAAGKGFAVVAVETKRLSSSTKALLDSLDTFVEGIDISSRKSSDSVEKTVLSIHKVNDAIKDMSVMMSKNMNSVNSITVSISSVAANSQELSASLEEAANTVDKINTDIQDISNAADNLDKIGKSLNEMSDLMSDVETKYSQLTARAGKMSNDTRYGLSNNDFLANIEDAVKAHNSWVNTLKTMVQKMEVSPIQTDDHKCGFGHFYHSVTPASSKVTALWSSIDAYHHELHSKGGETIKHIINGDALKANNTYSQAFELSIKIGKAFEEIIRLTKEMISSGERVL